MKTNTKYALLLIIAAFAFAGFTGKDTTATKTDKLKWKTGVALYSFNRHGLEKALSLAQQSGVKTVEGFSFYNLGPEFDNKSMGHLDDKGVAKLQKMLADKGLTMSSMYAGDGNNEEEWKRNFEIGRKLGLKFLVSEPRKELLGMIDSLAGIYNIKVAIHQHVKGTSAYWHPDSVLAATKGRKNIGACADLGHWVRSGLDPVKCLKILSGHVIAVHLKDIDKSNNDVDLGEGTIDFKGVVKELKRQRFTGTVNVECEHNWDNNLENVKQAINYFNAIATKK